MTAKTAKKERLFFMLAQWNVLEQLVWLALFILAGSYVGRQTFQKSEHGDKRD